MTERLFDADYAQTALGKKQREYLTVDDARYESLDEIDRALAYEFRTMSLLEQSIEDIINN